MNHADRRSLATDLHSPVKAEAIVENYHRENVCFIDLVPRPAIVQFLRLLFDGAADGELSQQRGGT